MRVAAASVPGPRHVRSGLPNEDVVATHLWEDGAAIVVADGVGSVTHARVGAEAAARAAIEVVGAWVEGSVDTSQIPALVNKQWQVLLAVPPSDAASTVCFVAVRNDGSWLAASIGDSSYLVATASRSCASPNRTAFADTTLALSGSFDELDWSTDEGGIDDRLGAAVVFTDGIGHDLDATRLSVLLDAIAAILREYGTEQASTELEVSLERWNTPAHTDDKSIACLITDGNTHA